jgi:hypothetical protein
MLGVVIVGGALRADTVLPVPDCENAGLVGRSGFKKWRRWVAVVQTPEARSRLKREELPMARRSPRDGAECIRITCDDDVKAEEGRNVPEDG